jgi:hypothetical protein
MRVRIELLVGLGIVLVSTVVTALEALHFFDQIDKLIPGSLKPMITPEHNLVLFAVGFLLIALAWAEHKYEMRKHPDSTPHRSSLPSEPPAITTQTASPSITQTASPVTTQKVEIYTHPTHSQNYVLQEKPKNERPKHNVHFLGAKRIWTDFEREVFDESDGVVAIKVSFLNESIPEIKIGDFDYAKARVVIRDGTGVEVASTANPKWLNHDIDDVVHIEKNCTESILLAVHGNGDKWVMPCLIPAPKGYWDDGSSGLMLDGQPLSFGEYEAHITLVDGDGLGIAPTTVRFSLGSKGETQIMPQ